MVKKKIKNLATAVIIQAKYIQGRGNFVYTKYLFKQQNNSYTKFDSFIKKKIFFFLINRIIDFLMFSEIEKSRKISKVFLSLVLRIKLQTCLGLLSKCRMKAQFAKSLCRKIKSGSPCYTLHHAKKTPCSKLSINLKFFTVKKSVSV